VWNGKVLEMKSHGLADLANPRADSLAQHLSLPLRIECRAAAR